MRTTKILVGLIILAFLVSGVSAQTLSAIRCCSWDARVNECVPTEDSNCDAEDKECVEIGFDHTAGHPICDCRDSEECQWGGYTPVALSSTNPCVGGCETGSCLPSFDAQENKTLCACGSATTTTSTTSSTTTTEATSSTTSTSTSTTSSSTTSTTEPVVGCRWNSEQQTCGGSCQYCLMVGYDYEKEEGICQCRGGPDGCRYALPIPDDLVFRAEGAAVNECIGDCETGLCQDVDSSGMRTECQCNDVPHVPEFATAGVALAIVLLSPAFAYLLTKRE